MNVKSGKSYKGLHEKEQLYLKMVSVLEEKNEEIKNLNEVNKELLYYIDHLEQKHNFKNQGKDVAFMSHTFMSRAKLALWFIK
jgi:hypothetical protein